VGFASVARSSHVRFDAETFFSEVVFPDRLPGACRLLEGSWTSTVIKRSKKLFSEQGNKPRQSNFLIIINSLPFHPHQARNKQIHAMGKRPIQLEKLRRNGRPHKREKVEQVTFDESARLFVSICPFCNKLTREKGVLGWISETKVGTQNKVRGHKACQGKGCQGGIEDKAGGRAPDVAG